MTKLRDIKQRIEERFHQAWTSLSIQYHFKAIASHVLNLSFSEINFHLDDEVSSAQLSKIDDILQELATNKPLQYVLGETVFMDNRILCEPVALIPRPETEELVELVLSATKEFVAPKILDLCTGTGCIAIALNKEISRSSLHGIDKFEDVIKLANQNNSLNNTSVQFNSVDVFNEIEMTPYMNESFDIWVSNPPYIPTRDKKFMEANVLEFEPPEALFVSDEDPLVFYRKIAQSAQKGLKSGGLLFYEIHEDFGQETIDLLTQEKFINIQLHSDLQGKNRMTSAMKK